MPETSAKSVKRIRFNFQKLIAAAGNRKVSVKRAADFLNSDPTRRCIGLGAAIARTTRSARRTGRRQALAVLLLAVLAAMAFDWTGLPLCGPARAAASADPAPAAADLQFLLGPEELVLGPYPFQFDNITPFVAVPGGIRAYVASGFQLGASLGPAQSFASFGPTLAAVFDEANTEFFEPVLAPPHPHADPKEVCGAWMNSIDRVSDELMIGWYHAEYDCAYQVTRKTMRVAHSRDNGLTWDKKGLVLASDSGLDGAGDATVVRFGDYYYMFFTEDWKKGVARSRTEYLGLPGTWHRWYNGDWTADGVDGQFTALNAGLAGTRVSYNSYLRRFISIGASSRYGFTLHISGIDDPANGWTEQPFRLMPAVSGPNDPWVDNWNYADTANNDRRLSLHAYTSIVAENGNTNTVGQDFFIYYARIPEGKNFDAMYLMRRKVTIFDQAQLGQYRSLVALSTYTSTDGRKTRTTVNQPAYENYGPQGQILGMLSTNSRSGHAPVYECHDTDQHDYKIVKNLPLDGSGNPYCPAAGEKFVRRLGWIAENPTETASLPLIECFDEANFNHYYITSSPDECIDPAKSDTQGYLVPARQPVEAAVYNQSKTGHDGRTKSRITTGASTPDASFSAPAALLGGVYQQDTGNLLALHECYINIWDDYMITASDRPFSDMNFCRHPTAEDYQGIVGWISPTPNAAASLPLIACFDEANLNHFYTTRQDGCGSARKDRTLGYILPPGLPDVVVDAVRLEPAEPRQGDSVRFTAVIRNQGQGPTPAGVAVGVGYRVDGQGVTWGATSTPLPAGATTEIATHGGPWTAAAGEHELTAVVDDAGRFAESDETNNTLGASFTVEAATSQIFHASSDFSGTQGYRNWYYLDGQGRQLAFDAARNWWRGSETYLLLWGNGGVPGQYSQAVRRWVAPGSGTIHIHGNAHGTNGQCGDGFTVTVKNGSQVLWTRQIAKGDSTGYNFDLAGIPVWSGTTIDFVLDKGSANNWCDNAYFDPTIEFTPGDNALVFSAAGDFSGTQGHQNWYYLDGQGRQLKFDAARNWWQGSETYLLLWNNGGVPGQYSQAVRRWVAPGAGTIRIHGNAHDTNGQCGDGFIATIKTASKVLWTRQIANGDASGHNFDLSGIAVANGTVIDFVLDKGKANNWCDNAYFDPTIEFRP